MCSCLEIRWYCQYLFLLKLRLAWHILGQFKCIIQWPLVHVQSAQPSPLSSSKTVSLTPKANPVPHEVVTSHPVPPAPGNRPSVFCLHGLSCSRKFTKMQSRNRGPFVSRSLGVADTVYKVSITIVRSGQCPVILSLCACNGFWLRRKKTSDYVIFVRQIPSFWSSD